MLKITLELNNKQIENLIERLPLKEKVELAQRLTSKTWQVRFKNLLSRVDTRLKNRRIPSNAKIVQIVKGVRKRHHA